MAVVVTTTVSFLVVVPSPTVSVAVYEPAMSARNEGVMVVLPDREAELPFGFFSVQVNVSASPSTSDDPAPLTCTKVPASTWRLGPALATGRLLVVVMVTSSGALKRVRRARPAAPRRRRRGPGAPTALPWWPWSAPPRWPADG